MRIFASTSDPFRPSKVQMPNLALIETKRITVLKGGKFVGGDSDVDVYRRGALCIRHSLMVSKQKSLAPSNE